VNTYELMFTPDSGEETTRLASVQDGKVSGKMRASVERQIDIGSISLGITGRTLTYTVSDPDLVAYALSRANADLVDAGIIEPGRVYAVGEDGQEVSLRDEDDIASDVIII
jgi:hypothetical protein